MVPVLKSIDLNTEKKGWPWNVEVSSHIYKERPIWPKISIVTPSYNQGKFIEETIRSVLLQNYPNLEYIIIDGGSTDGTIDIIKNYASQITYWVSEKDNGQSNAINKGLSRCTGNILHWLNSDDYLLFNALYHIGSFPWQEDTGAVVGIGHKVDLKGSIKYTPNVPDLSFNILLHWVGYANFMQPACFFSAKAWKECGPLNETLHFCLDVDLWLKIAQKYKFEKIHENLAHAYIHEQAKTTAEKEKMKIETALLVATYGGFEVGRKVLYQFVEEYHLYRKTHHLIFYNPFVKLVKKVVNKICKFF